MNKSIIIKLVFIVLLNKVYAYDTQNIEVILLPLWDWKSASEIPLTFKVFGRLIQLTLHRNDKIISSQFQVWKHNTKGIEELSELSTPDPCYYLHRDHTSSAAINFCQERGLHGLIFLNNVTLEITPLQNELTLSPLVADYYIKEKADFPGELHMVKRSPKYPLKKTKLELYLSEQNDRKWILFNDSFKKQSNVVETRNEILTLELAVFFDEIAYRLFSPFLDEDDEKIRNMLLAYVNGIQALYHHPSLGVLIDISLVRLDIIKKQPIDLPHYDGERGNLLDSFCNYAEVRNPSKDIDPRHWDLGLYVTGLDLYVLENGRRNGATMGLATVGGLCIAQYSCVIAELGVIDQFGKPYPSAGFASIYIAAHEIGHNLGMHHDSSGNVCPKDGYIMSPSRGIRGETTWSDCSREIAKMLSQMKTCLLDKPPSRNDSDTFLEHSRYHDLPGREWTAKKQCELLLRDKDANIVTLYQVCQSLQCRTPHRSAYYFAGPALDGTFCETGKECRGGECIPILEFPNISTVQKGSWGEWKEGSCNSDCLEKSKGARIRQRSCENRIQHQNQDWRTVNCKGLHYDVLLCKDKTFCKGKRRTTSEFATLKCSVFSEKLSELDSTSRGLQAIHEPEKPWIACAIFCELKDMTAYYAPRVELSDLGLDPYFPDGTWCHNEEDQDYFCRQHHCLPESFQFGKQFPKDYHNEDKDTEELKPHTTHRFKITDKLIKYLTLAPDGLPLLTSISPMFSLESNEDDKDYNEIPVLTSATESRYSNNYL